MHRGQLLQKANETAAERATKFTHQLALEHDVVIQLTQLLVRLIHVLYLQTTNLFL